MATTRNGEAPKGRWESGVTRRTPRWVIGITARHEPWWKFRLDAALEVGFALFGERRRALVAFG